MKEMHMTSAEWSSFWGREREGASGQGAWVWAWISEAGQAKKTEEEGISAQLASPRKISPCVRQGLVCEKKSARRFTTSAARFCNALRLSSGVNLVSPLGFRTNGLLMSKGGRVTSLRHAERPCASHFKSPHTSKHGACRIRIY
jgi:hypothetical protein